MRLRQVALVARDLEATVADLCAVLEIEVAFRDPGVALFGLVNAVLPVGDTFLEVVSPVKPGRPPSACVRRGGDAGYMVIVQVADLAARANAWRARRSASPSMRIRRTRRRSYPRHGAAISLDAAIRPRAGTGRGPPGSAACAPASSPDSQRRSRATRPQRRGALGRDSRATGGRLGANSRSRSTARCCLHPGRRDGEGLSASICRGEPLGAYARSQRGARGPRVEASGLDRGHRDPAVDAPTP
jgi:hypothetical protein